MSSEDDGGESSRVDAESSEDRNDSPSPIDHVFLARHGLLINEQGGLYRKGHRYHAATKLLVHSCINRLGEDDISTINISQVSKETNTSRGFVRKVHNEMIENNGNIVDPCVIRQERAKGPGVKTFDECDMFVLLMLYFEEPSRSNASYVERLYCATGTVTSTSTVSRWFNNYFPISGGFRKPNLVPIDKFRERNCMRAQEYLDALSIIAPHKLRFGDEKLIKGAEVYCRRTRRNVLTGELLQYLFSISSNLIMLTCPLHQKAKSLA